MTQPPTRTIAYLRVSTEKQADHGISLDAQRERVQQYAKLYELDLVEIIVDAGESAKTLDRPGLQKALASLKGGRADAILVVKLDRLTRSVVHLGELVEEYFSEGRWALLSVGEQIDTRSAAGRLILNILASVSQWEREAISERTAAAMQFKAEAGEYCGGRAPFGFKLAADGIHLELVPSEQEAIAMVRAYREQGQTLRAISKLMAEQGIRSRSGQVLTPIQISRMAQPPKALALAPVSPG